MQPETSLPALSFPPPWSKSLNGSGGWRERSGISWYQEGTRTYRVLATESHPVPASVKFTPYRPGPSSAHFWSSLISVPPGVPVLPYFIPPDITVLSAYSSFSTRLPIGTMGFSRVLRRNFSLKLSVVL